MRDAINKLQADDNCSVISVSSIYETKPYGYKEQDNFFNAAMELRTNYKFTDLFLF